MKRIGIKRFTYFLKKLLAGYAFMKTLECDVKWLLVVALSSRS